MMSDSLHSVKDSLHNTMISEPSHMFCSDPGIYGLGKGFELFH